MGYRKERVCNALQGVGDPTTRYNPCLLISRLRCNSIRWVWLGPNRLNAANPMTYHSYDFVVVCDFILPVDFISSCKIYRNTRPHREMDIEMPCARNCGGFPRPESSCPLMATGKSWGAQPLCAALGIQLRRRWPLCVDSLSHARTLPHRNCGNTCVFC